MAISVAGLVEHKLPRPTKCDHCGSKNVALQKRSLMGYKIYGKWDLCWHCGDCMAMVGCHEGTDIPYGTMADHQTRAARNEAHAAFDPMWKKHVPHKQQVPMLARFVSRDLAYRWLAEILNIPYSRAHIAMLDGRQCEALIEACRQRISSAKGVAKKSTWQVKVRKKRR